MKNAIEENAKGANEMRKKRIKKNFKNTRDYLLLTEEECNNSDNKVAICNIHKTYSRQIKILKGK